MNDLQGPQHSRRPVVAIVHNNKVRFGDYRVQLYLNAQSLRVLFLAPGRPDAVEEADYVASELREGFSVGDVKGFLALFRALWQRRHQITVCHFFSTKLLLAGPVFAAICGLQSVITITGFGRVFSKPRPAMLILRVPYASMLLLSTAIARRVFCQNLGHERVLKAWLPWCRRKIVYLGSGVLFPRFERVVCSRVKPRVLCVSRLIAAKGIDVFLDVAERMSDRFEFVLIGTRSPNGDALYARVQDSARRDIITFPGEIQGEALVAAYQGCDIFLLPGAYGEGLSRVLVEAALSCLVPIAADSAANRDLIGEGQGYLLDSPSVEKICAILNLLLRDRDSLIAQARAFQQGVSKRYDMTAFIHRYELAMRPLLPQSAAGSSRHEIRSQIRGSE